ncbi:MAG: phosphatase PAP2 family protein [Rhizobiaceae bacterium]
MTRPEEANIFRRSAATFFRSCKRVFRPSRATVSQPLIPPQRVFWLCLAIVIVLTTWSFAMHDAGVIRWKRQALQTDGAFVTLFQYITLTGTSGWILVITAVIGLALSVSPWQNLPGPERRRRVNLYEDVNFIFFTVALSGIAANLIKNSIGRARPRLLEELGPHHFNPGAFEPKFASFPSGHSTTSGAIARALILLWPRYWPLWLLFGLLGGLSRIVVDAHYPSDVLAGLTFGGLFVLLTARWLARRNVMFQLGVGWMPLRKRHRA